MRLKQDKKDILNASKQLDKALQASNEEKEQLNNKVGELEVQLN